MAGFSRTTVVVLVASLALSVTACSRDDLASPAEASASATLAPASKRPAPSAERAPGTPPASGYASTAAPVWPPTGPNLTLHRSGGFAGVSQRIVVNPNGGWTYRDLRDDDRAQRGRLAGADLRQLREMLAGPALAREAKTSRPSETCADAFLYVLAFGELTVRWSACGDPDEPERATAIVNLMELRTPF